ncbi:MAG: hypothetical protein OHK0040_04220 [bacterium]
MEKLKVLVAENDERSLQGIKEALDEQLYDIVIATDGVQALQVALQSQPAIIILTLDLPLIDGVKLSQIIRSNPKTETIPIFYLNEKTVHLSHFRRNTDYFIIKPFNADELKKIVNGVRKKILNITFLKKEEEFSGNLKQMSMPDLLQVLSMNQKTGNLFIYIEHGDKESKATISLEKGRIINALSGKITGLKALYRIVSIKEGFFRFIPGEPELPPAINEGTDSLIMEGLRQNDEMQEIRKKLGGEKVKVYLNISSDKIPKGLRPKTMEVLSAIEVFPDLDELIDNVTVLDYEVLKIIQGLKEKNVVRIEDITDEKGTDNITFSADLILELKKAINKKFFGTKPPYNLIMPVFLEGENHDILLKTLINFSFFPQKEDLLCLRRKEKSIGYLGTLQLVESMNIILVYFYDKTPFKPFFNSYLNRSLGALVVGGREKFSYVANFYGKRAVFVSVKELGSIEGLKRAIEKIFDNFIGETL